MGNSVWTAMHAMAGAYGKAFQRIHERLELLEDAAMALDERTRPHTSKSMKPRLRHTDHGWQPTRNLESAGEAMDRLGVTRVAQDAEGEWRAA